MGPAGAGGGSRTHTPLARHRVLSPACLPFHHSGPPALCHASAPRPEARYTAAFFHLAPKSSGGLRVKGQILILDDEPELLQVFAELLRDAGHEVATVCNVPEALGLLARGGFDAVVSDINMPGMGGIDLLRAVRERDPDLPVLLVTGNPTLETAIQALEHGAVQYLLKPVLSDVLVSGVERSLRLRRMATLRREALSYLREHPGPEADRASLDASLSRALAGLWIAYQPIVRASDGSVFGHEALLRTTEQSLPDPGALLAAAERLGRVPEVGRGVRGRVATMLEEAAIHGSVFVNLHVLDLSDAALLSPDAPLSKRARDVVLEITERASIEAIPDVRGRVRALREMGYRIAVDDLGAGYAGLTSFAALEPEVVKLDIALVRGVHSEPVKQKLISSMCSLCKDLGILVVAEGIETVAERDVLIELGCDLLQGYLFGRPSPRPQPVPAPC